MERVEPLTEEPDFERTIDPRRRTQRTFPWPLIAAIIAGGAGNPPGFPV